jgi:hypothetical protein
MPTAFTVPVSSNGYNSHHLEKDCNSTQNRESNNAEELGAGNRDVSQQEQQEQQEEATNDSKQVPIAVGNNAVLMGDDRNYIHHYEPTLNYTEEQEVSSSEQHRDRNNMYQSGNQLDHRVWHRDNLQRCFWENSALTPSGPLFQKHNFSTQSAAPQLPSDDCSSLVNASSILHNMKQPSTTVESNFIPSLSSSSRGLEQSEIGTSFIHHEEHDNDNTTTTTTTTTTPQMQGLLHEHEVAMRERMIAHNRLQNRMNHIIREQEEMNPSPDGNYHKGNINHDVTTNDGHGHDHDIDYLIHQPYLHPKILSQMNHKSVAMPTNNGKLDYPPVTGRPWQPNINVPPQPMISNHLGYSKHYMTATPRLPHHSNFQQEYAYGPFHSEGSNDELVNPQLGLGYDLADRIQQYRQNHMNNMNDSYVDFITHRTNDLSRNRHPVLKQVYNPSFEHAETSSNATNKQQTLQVPPHLQNVHLSFLLQQHEKQQQQLLSHTKDFERFDQDSINPFSLHTMNQSIPVVDQDHFSDGGDCFEGIRRSGQLSGVRRQKYSPVLSSEKESGERSIKSTETSSLATSSLMSYPTRMLDGTGYQGSPKQWSIKSHTNPKSSKSSIRRRQAVSLKDLKSSPCSKAPMALGVEEDREHLSMFLQFLRTECCEVFTASEKDVFHRRKSKQIRLHQVGIRCALCANIPYMERTLRSSCYPSSFDRIYQSVTMMIRDHFADCPHFSESMRTNYDTIKASSVRKGNYEAKSYWIKSAQSLGIVETEEGLFFLK